MGIIDVGIQFPSVALLRHALAIGSSGSGKTVLCKAIIEELMKYDVPVIAIDTQGDIASMSLAEDAKGKSIASEVKLYSVGEDFANRISIDPLAIGNAEDCARVLLTMVDMDSDELLAALTVFIRTYMPETIHDVIALNQQDKLMGFQDYATKNSLGKLSRAIAGLEVGSSGRLITGNPLTMDDLMGGGMSVICAWNLDRESQISLVAFVSAMLYDYMLSKGGTNVLRGVLFLDEIAPYMPPVKNTPAKESLVMLARQARKYGIGLLLATQSIGDIDYKALANVSNLFLGRVVARQDLDKIGPMLDVYGLSFLADKLPTHEAGEFAIVSPDVDGDKFKVRWLHTKHKALTESEVKNIVKIQHYKELKNARRSLIQELNNIARMIKDGNRDLIPAWKDGRLELDKLEGIINGN